MQMTRREHTSTPGRTSIVAEGHQPVASLHIQWTRSGTSSRGGRTTSATSKKGGSQPMPALELEVVPDERPRRACTQEDATKKKKQ